MVEFCQKVILLLYLTKPWQLRFLMIGKMFFSLKAIPTDFLSHKVRIIVVVIWKWAADNRKCLVRTDWKIGLFTEKKVRAEKQAKGRDYLVYTWGVERRHSVHAILREKKLLWWIIINKRLSVCMHEWLIRWETCFLSL